MFQERHSKTRTQGCQNEHFSSPKFYVIKGFHHFLRFDCFDKSRLHGLLRTKDRKALERSSAARKFVR